MWWNKKQKQTMLKLDAKDAALVLRGNGKMEVALPKGSEGEKLPDTALILTALMIKLEDSNFTNKLVQKAFNKLDREVEPPI
jgi:hypothetical protein